MTTNTILSKIRYRSRNIKTRYQDRFLRKLKGVIHIGANVGQERGLYARKFLKVIWIEPIPEVFQILNYNIQDYPEQRAFNYLITDEDYREYQFYQANNFGASSSILKLDRHKKIWPDVEYEKTINMRSVTLLTFCQKENINLSMYDGLVLDTQGSELMILKGAIPLLPYFKYIKTEAPDFDAYENCCKTDELSTFLKHYNFHEISRIKFAQKKGVGSYYDLLYKQINR
jgi:FkbM family methyltransferase